MTIYTGGPATRRSRILEEYNAPLLDTLKVTAEEALLYSPTSSLLRLDELWQAEEGEIIRQYVPGEGMTYRQLEPKSPVVPAEEARRRVEESGLDMQIPGEGIREEALNIRLDRKAAERRRRDVLARAPGGFTPAVARLGVALGASMLDPLNVASAFIPVVGQARYAALLRNASGPGGRALVRTGVGAVEGVAGAAMVEPIVVAAADYEQADYGMVDSMLNIAFGTIFGAGLHVGAGAVGDALAKGQRWWQTEPDGATAKAVAEAAPKDRKALLQTAVSQAASGRYVDVEPLWQYRQALAELAPETMADARKLAVRNLSRELREELAPEAGAALSRGEIQALKREKADLDFRIERAEASFKETAKRIQRDEKVSRKRAEQLARQRIEEDVARLREQAQVAETRLAKAEPAKAAKGDMSRLDQGIVPERFKERVEAEAKRIMEASGKERPVAVAVRQALAPKAQRASNAFDAVRAQAENIDDVRNYRLADVDAMQRHQAELKESRPAGVVTEADEALADALDRLNETQAALERELQAELAAADELIAQADDYSAALRAAALCTLRRA